MNHRSVFGTPYGFSDFSYDSLKGKVSTYIVEKFRVVMVMDIVTEDRICYNVTYEKCKTVCSSERDIS